MVIEMDVAGGLSHKVWRMNLCRYALLLSLPNMMCALAQGHGVPAKLVASPLKFSKTPASYRQAPPALGEHTEDLERRFDLKRLETRATVENGWKGGAAAGRLQRGRGRRLSPERRLGLQEASRGVTRRHDSQRRRCDLRGSHVQNAVPDPLTCTESAGQQGSRCKRQDFANLPTCIDLRSFERGPEELQPHGGQPGRRAGARGCEPEAGCRVCLSSWPVAEGRGVRGARPGSPRGDVRLHRFRLRRISRFNSRLPNRRTRRRRRLRQAGP